MSRKGLVDLHEGWRRQIRLLANGQATSFQGTDAENVVEDMGRFTAAMVCIVATLDSFAALSAVKCVMRSTLTELLRTTETGEHLLSSQYAPRLNAWRSTARLMLDRVKINAFCAFQSFFMGYHYSIFFRVVDMSSLILQTVEGSWGFRSPDFLFYVRTQVLSQRSSPKGGGMTNMPETALSGQGSPAKYISRQTILQVLSRLLLNRPNDIPMISSTSEQSDHWCMGIVAKRTLVINSLLGKCHSMEEIGQFALLDVDVGGIPRDSEGLIRPGLPDDCKELEMIDNVQQNLVESSPIEDVTLHVEADWEANPDTALLCVR